MDDQGMDARVLTLGYAGCPTHPNVPNSIEFKPIKIDIQGVPFASTYQPGGYLMKRQPAGASYEPHLEDSHPFNCNVLYSHMLCISTNTL
jgi:hypothetical protein